MDKKCENCAFASAVLDAEKDLLCEIFGDYVDADFSCPMYAMVPDLGPEPELDECRDMPEGCWLD